MKISTLLITLSALIFTTVLHSQTRQMINEFYQVDEYVKRQDKGVKYANKADYKGTPYHNPEYVLGNVYEGDELMAYEVALRYNAVSDEVEIKESLISSDEDARVLTKDPNIFVKIQNDIFVFVPLNGSIEEGGYFQILFEGTKVDLYKKIIKEFQPGKKASSSLTKDIPPVFKDASLYFVVTTNGRFYQLPESRAKKLDIFGGSKPQIEQYAQEHNLNITEEADLLKVIKYFDSI